MRAFVRHALLVASILALVGTVAMQSHALSSRMWVSSQTQGLVQSYVLGSGWTGYSVSVSTPRFAKFGPGGKLYISSYLGDTIYEHTSGLGLNPFMLIEHPRGFDFDANGNLYGIADSRQVLKRAANGTVSYVGSWCPSDDAAFGPDNSGDSVPDFYIASASESDPQLRVLSSTGGGHLFDSGYPVSSRPYGLTWGPDVTGDSVTDLFVADRDRACVSVYNGASGAYVYDFVAAGAGGLTAPVDIAFSPDGRLYVADQLGAPYRGAVRVFKGPAEDIPGEYVTSISGVDNPQCIAFKPGVSDRIWIGTPTEASVWEYNIGVGWVGKTFDIPSVFDMEFKDGKLYASSIGGNAVKVYDFDLNTLSDYVTIDEPIGFAWGQDGTFYVISDKAERDTIYRMAPGGTLERWVAFYGGRHMAFGPANFGGMENLYVAGSGRIFVPAEPDNIGSQFTTGAPGSFATNRRFDSGAPASSYYSITWGPDTTGDGIPEAYALDQARKAVVKLNGATGEYISDYLPPQSYLTQAYDIKFGPDGEFYIADFGSNAVRVYTGDPATHWKNIRGLDNPIAVAFHPDYPDDVWILSWAENCVYRYRYGTGWIFEFNVTRGWHMDFGPDKKLYVSCPNENKVKQYDPDTQALVDYADVVGPLGLTFSPDGLLYVVSNIDDINDKILRRKSDGSMEVYATSRLATHLAFGPDNMLNDGVRDLYVARRHNNTQIRVYGAPDSSHHEPSGIAWGPDTTGDGKPEAYVSDRGRKAVAIFNGATGAYISDFVQPGTGGLLTPAGLAFGPDGNLYVADEGTYENVGAVRVFQGPGGASPGAHVQDILGLDRPTSVAFEPPATEVDKIGNAKSKNLGDLLSLTGKVVTAVFVDDGVKSFYIEEDDRSSGIKVYPSGDPNILVGDRVSVIGTLNEDANGELCLNGASVEITANGQTVPPPLGQNNKAMVEGAGQHGPFGQVLGFGSAHCPPVFLDRRRDQLSRR
jgi:DNA-binding beta-propeller fold protein YncE